MPYDMRKMQTSIKYATAYATVKNPNFCADYAAADYGSP